MIVKKRKHRCMLSLFLAVLLVINSFSLAVFSVNENDAEYQIPVQALSLTEDVDTGSPISIGEISAVSDDKNYYTVSVPYSVQGDVPKQMTIFAYDITALTASELNNTVGFSAETPVSYINQFEGTVSGDILHNRWFCSECFVCKIQRANYSDRNDDR